MYFNKEFLIYLIYKIKKTVVEIAEGMGISLKSLRRYMKGERPDIKSLKRIADYFDKSPNDFLKDCNTAVHNRRLMKEYLKEL